MCVPSLLTRCCGRGAAKYPDLARCGLKRARPPFFLRHTLMSGEWRFPVRNMIDYMPRPPSEELRIHNLDRQDSICRLVHYKEARATNSSIPHLLFTMQSYIETLSNWESLPVVAGILKSDAYGVEFKIPQGQVVSIGSDRTCDFQAPPFFKNIGGYPWYEL